jgi:ribonuclease P protein component
MLSSVNRLTKKIDFENVRQNGKFISSKLFAISYVKGKGDGQTHRSAPTRFGFIVSKKISTKAHERNHIKRILREYFRKNLDRIKAGYDYVIVAKVGILHATHAKIEDELKNALKNI